MASIISWFEIPVINTDRAIAFYTTLLGVEMQKAEMGGMLYTFFPPDESGLGGALVQSDQYVPNATGCTIYLNGGNDLSEPLSRIEGAGGSVILPKTFIGEGMGYSALFLDTEGNRVGLYSPN